MAELDPTNGSKKIEKIEKKIFDIFPLPRGTPPHPHISAQGALIENRLDELETMPMVTIHAKFEVSMMIHVGCRGGGLKTDIQHHIFRPTL